MIMVKTYPQGDGFGAWHAFEILERGGTRHKGAGTYEPAVGRRGYLARMAEEGAQARTVKAAVLALLGVR